MWNERKAPPIRPQSGRSRSISILVVPSNPGSKRPPSSVRSGLAGRVASYPQREALLISTPPRAAHAHRGGRVLARGRPTICQRSSGLVGPPRRELAPADAARLAGSDPSSAEETVAAELTMHDGW